jgi:hypothetical protein
VPGDDKGLLFRDFGDYIWYAVLDDLRTGAPEKETLLSKASMSKQSLSKNSKDVMERAEASFKKEERAREGAKAMREYEAESRAVHEKTARLKALRLAKEAAEKEAEPK